MGYYLSTPIWSFRIKHAACGGWLEVRTDPKNTQYVVAEGGKARDYGDAADKVREGEGGMPILTETERQRRREDAFANLEGKVEEKRIVKDNTRRIEELYRSSERDWNDPWKVNRRMRDSFRHERKIRKRDEEATEALKEKLGTDIELLPEAESDVRMARLVDFGPADLGSRDDEAGTKAVFQASKIVRSSSRTRAEKANHAETLRRQLLRNTRASLNPFSVN